MPTDRSPSDHHRGAAPVGVAALCDATLVLHADGSLACPRVEVCDAQPELHPWWITCTELTSPCGCTGDEHPGAGRPGSWLLARAA